MQQYNRDKTTIIYKELSNKHLIIGMPFHIAALENGKISLQGNYFFLDVMPSVSSFCAFSILDELGVSWMKTSEMH